MKVFDTMEMSPGQPVSRIIDHIHERAEIMPDSIAVRYLGSAPTFGELSAAIDEYERQLTSLEISPAAAFYAALFHVLPGLSVARPEALGALLGDITEWLSRGLRGVGDGHLRAI